MRHIAPNTEMVLIRVYSHNTTTFLRQSAIPFSLLKTQRDTFFVSMARQSFDKLSLAKEFNEYILIDEDRNAVKVLFDSQINLGKVENIPKLFVKPTDMYNINQGEYYRIGDLKYE